MISEITETDQIDGTALVVDDDPIVVSLLSRTLERAGAHVHKASSGFEALTILQDHEIDVVLSDISMEGMSGFDLVRKIKEDHHAIEIILITGHDSFDMVRSALRTGVYDYLVKPLKDRVEVIATVNRAIDSVKLKRENSSLIGRLRAKSARAESANCRLSEQNQQLRQLANTDSLTSLYNRRYIDESINNFIGSQRSSERIYSIVLLDVDFFKDVNDTHGHTGGDKILVQLAAILKNATRQSDLVGRYGGEEFIVFMPGTDQDRAMRTAERLRCAIGDCAFELDSGKVHVTVSLGIASNVCEDSLVEGHDEESGCGGELVEKADRALYVSKNEGRNICRHFSQLKMDNDESGFLQRLSDA